MDLDTGARQPSRAATAEVGVSRPQPLRPRHLPVLLALVAAGLAGHYFALPLFFGLDFLLGSVFTLLAVQLFGVRWGVAAATLVGLGTLLFWDHPWAATVLIAEALVVGVLAPRLRHNLLLADGFFWLLAGIPLVGLTYGLLLETSTAAALLLALKQSVNGLFNALLASITLTYTPLRAAAGVAERRTVPLRQRVYEVLVAAVLLPTLGLVVVDTDQDRRKLEQDLEAQLDATATSLASRLDTWRVRNVWAITQLSVTAGELAPAPGRELDRATAQVARTHPELRRVYVADLGGSILAQHPPAVAIGGGAGAASPPAAEHARFLREVLAGPHPLISPTYRGPRGVPMVTIAAPVPGEGEPRGVVVGEMEARQLRELLHLYAPSPGARLVLADARDVVIASTASDLPALSTYHEEGEVWPSHDGRYRRLPADPGATPVSRWRSSFYGRRILVGNPPWQLTVELPVAPLQSFMEKSYLQGFALMAAACAVALLLGAVVSLGLARPLARLAEASTDLPERLASGELPSWPRSRIAEIDSLGHNFRSMGRALESRFQELTTASAALTQRSAEIAAANRELQNEIAERTRAEATLRLLAEAGSLLATSLEVHDTLDRTARFCVPELADWAIVALGVGEDAVPRCGVAHRYPATEQRLRAAAARAPGPLLADGEGLDRPLVVADPLEWTVSGGDTLGSLLREVGAASALVAPLRARGRTLGTLVLVRSPGGGPAYDAASLPLAEELARRAALALDNAALFGALRDADRRKDEFVAMLAHELRNPLAPLATSLELLRAGAPPELRERTLAVMERQLGHVVRLVDDLLDVARITRGRIELHPEPLDLAAAVAQTVENLRPRFVERGQQLALELETDAPLPVRADATRLDQVVANLLANANKYTPAGGHVWVRVHRHGEHGVVTVRDDGMGMPRDLLARVFDLFMQSEQALDRSQGGLGIGLTLVRQLVERHGGTVQARSEGPGKGSEFEVRLPLDATASLPHSAASARPVAAGEGRQYVLVVDDNVEGAESLAELLRLWGHRVAVAHDGPSGLALAERERPEVVLLDIGLPGLDGYEVGRRLRAREGTRHALLVAVTGYGDQVHGGRLEEIGFDHLLIKPVRPPELRELLREAARAPGSTAPAS